MRNHPLGSRKRDAQKNRRLRQNLDEKPFEGTVRDLSSRGHGVVAHPSGRVYFVPGVWPGERGTFTPTSIRGQTGQATLAELTERSPLRQAPPCPHHGFAPRSCGGCPWQFMAYDAQIAAKESRVRSALASLVTENLIKPIWGSPQEWGYRNRTQVKTDGREIGYVSAEENILAPVSDCLVLSDKNRQTLQQLRSTLPNPAWRSPKKQNWLELEFDEDIDAAHVEPGQKRPFLQGNSAQNERMRKWLSAACEAIDSDHKVVELFAGSGNFTEILEQHGFSEVFAIDSFAPAIEALSERGFERVKASRLDLFRDDAPTSLKKVISKSQVLFLDPPRDGMRLLGELLEAGRKLEWLIYVSCDVATFRRDVQFAMDAGFQAIEIQPLDLFPHTPHVELLSIFRRT